MNFVAMDFETASGKRWSACSLSLVVVRQNQIVDEFYTLINPQTPFFAGATFRSMAFMKNDVANAPVFPEVWEHIQPFFDANKLGDCP